MDFPMYMFKARRGLKPKDDSKVNSNFKKSTIFLHFSVQSRAAWISLTPCQPLYRRRTSCPTGWLRRKDATESTNALPSWRNCCQNTLSSRWVVSQARESIGDASQSFCFPADIKFWSFKKKKINKIKVWTFQSRVDGRFNCVFF